MEGIVKFNGLTTYLGVVLANEKKSKSCQEAESQNPFPS
jgi:hypothetical protein